MAEQRAESVFVYVTYIRTTAEKLWEALQQPEFTRKYWVETVQECEWKVGSPWKLKFPDGRLADSGEVVEIDPPRKLVLTWRHEFFPEMMGEGYGLMTYELEQQGEMVKLSVRHEMDKPDSRMIKGVSNGWPVLLASLKSLLETGESLEATRKMPA